jgi:hypothetical protein
MEAAKKYFLNMIVAYPVSDPTLMARKKTGLKPVNLLQDPDKPGGL